MRIVSYLARTLTKGGREDQSIKEIFKLVGRTCW